MSDLESLSIGTKFGTFWVQDARDPSDTTEVARLVPVGGKFKIRGKEYERPVSLVRSAYGEEQLYIRSDYSGELTDFARRQLLGELGIVGSLLPPLTRAEKVDRIIETVVSRSRSMLEYELKAVITNAAQSAGMGYGPAELTTVERVRLEQAQLDVVRDWLAEREQS